MFPNFLCIGAQRSGTTWLHYNLQQHPEIWLPPLKELHYFDEVEMIRSLPSSEVSAYKLRRYKRHWWLISKSIKQKKKAEIIEPSLQMLRWYWKYFIGPRNDRWYSSLFEMGKGKKIGEITPEYGPLNLESVKHIRELMPNTKIIFLMRNPIDRAWSHALKSVRDKKRSIESVSEAEFKQHFDCNLSRKKSDYRSILETWRTCYPEEQIFTAFFEEVTECPEDLLVRIINFIGVESSFDRFDKTSYNKINSTKNTGIPQDFARYLSRIYYQEIEELNRYLGGYSHNWLKRAEQLLE